VKELIPISDELFVKNIMEYPAILWCSNDCTMDSILKRLVAMEDMGNNLDIIVVKDDTRIKGIMTPIDIFNALQPSCSSQMARGYLTYEVFWNGLFTARCKRLGNKKVKEFMKSPVGLSPEDTLMRAVNFMVEHQTNIAPVISNEDVVGLVHSKTLVRIMSNSVA